MKKKIFEENIECNKCGYHNHKRNVVIYGTCLMCGNVLDEKAKFKYEMNKKLRLWRRDI